MDDDDDSEKFKKLFIGGLNYETTDETLHKYFGEWGEIHDCIVMKDPVLKRYNNLIFIYNLFELI